MSQMDSDNFVPIWAVACMEDIKALTADVDLIVDVLRGITAATPLSLSTLTAELVTVNTKIQIFKMAVIQIANIFFQVVEILL